MSRLIAKLTALVVLATLGTALAAGDDKPDPITLAKLAEWAPASGGLVSPDGKLSVINVGGGNGLMVLGGGNGNGRVYRQVKLCETATGKELAVILGASAMCFSADGRVLCVEQSFEEPLAKAGIVTPLMAMPQLWDVSNPEKPKQLFVVDGAAQESFSADGKRLLIAGWPDQKNGNAGKVITGLPSISKKGVARGGAMPFGAGGGFISASRTFEVWEVASAKFISRYEPTKGKCSLTSPVFNEDGNLVASVVTIKGSGSTISLYDMDKKKEVRRVAPGWKHSQFPDDSSQEQLQFVPSHMSPGEGPSQLLAAAIDAKATAELNLYDPTTGKLVTTLHKEKQSADTMIQLQFCVSADGKTLAAVVQRFKLGGAPLPAGGFPFGGMGGGALPAPAPAKGQGKQQGGFGGGGILVPQAGQNPAAGPPVGGFGGAVGGFGVFGGPGFGMPRPDAGEVIVFDLEKRAKKYSLAVVAQSARFAADNTLAAIVFDGQTTKLKLWDVVSAKEVGGLDACDLVHFAADGATMLTRCGDANGMAVKVWKVERAKK